jgi:L-idonate 5-dehydrogenase
MKAAVIHAPHDLRIEEREVPALGAHDVQVRVRNGGICGSDLHYFHHGGFGAVRVKAPMILGHEVAGEVVAVGAGVKAVAVGQTVAVNPSLPCNVCRFCLAGRQQHCLDMRFYGSAMRNPHVDGGFREMLVCTEAQAVPADMPVARAAFAEPLAVCLHAGHQAGDLLGARVLVTGAGPIGALLVMVARHAGAAEIVTTDLADEPLWVSRRIGADHTVNMRSDPDGLAPFAAEKGRFDVAFEASGSGAALAGLLGVVRPGGTIVQVGNATGDVSLTLSTLLAKEITLRGTFRFHAEFAQAVAVLASGRFDVAPLLTEVVPLADAVRAFELATDRTKAMKVQLAF